MAVSKSKAIWLWVFSFIFTIAIAYYQRKTGPTTPVRGSVNIEDTKVKYKLLTTSEGSDDAEIILNVPDDVSGYIRYKRFKSYDDWTETPMFRNENELHAFIPGQPPAGKVEYFIVLKSKNQEYVLTENPVIIRFKGFVSRGILIPHIIFIFLAMVFSTRTGLEAILRGKRTFVYTCITIVLLFFGGLLFGPLIQKAAFGEYWTGWPFGHDLTDNKTVVAFIFWIVAFFSMLKNRERRTWVIVAAILLLIVYLVPHSVLGSEIDHTKP
jgi:hypothetical protein